MARKNILMLAGDYVEDYEVMVPFQMLLLAAADVLQGRQCTAYPSVRPEVERAGAHRVDVNETFSNAHVDDNLVTAPAWPAHPEWIGKFLEVLGTRIDP
jgi:protease I